MHPPMPMHEMSKLDFFLNNPEWMAVVASSIFAFVTVCVIIWQAVIMNRQANVMKWQAENSDLCERQQNRLIRLQLEMSRLQLLNAERAQLLKLARNLHLVAGCLKETTSDVDEIHWEQMQDAVYELNERLNALDPAVYSSSYDTWFMSLKNYVDALLKAVIEDGEFKDSFGMKTLAPSLSTRKALKGADDQCKPIDIFLDLEGAIRMEFFEFKEKWDTETKD